MCSISKVFSVLFVVILSASSLIMVEPAFAQDIPKPSVPEFTLKFVDASYDVPTTSSIDPYTGKNVIHQGYHVENRTIEVSIKNHPFTKYESDGQITDLNLNVRTKGRYAENWTNIYSPGRGFLTQSNSDYTSVSYSLDDNEFPFWDNLNQSGQVDFQVEALIGSVHRIIQMPWNPWVFEGQTSGWSNTQTITIPETSTSASPNPTSSSNPTTAPSSSATDSTGNLISVPLSTLIVVVAVFLVIIAALALLFFRNHRKNLSVKTQVKTMLRQNYLRAEKFVLWRH